MNSCAKSTDPPLAASGGVIAPVRDREDPYRALDDLMAVVEALCPLWPQRDVFLDGGRMLL